MHVVIASDDFFSKSGILGVLNCVSEGSSTITIVDDDSCGAVCGGSQESLNKVGAKIIRILQRNVCRVHIMQDKLRALFDSSNIVVVDMSCINIESCKKVLNSIKIIVASSYDAPKMLVLVCKQFYAIRIARFSHDILYVNDMNLCQQDIANITKQYLRAGLSLRVAGKTLSHVAAVLLKKMKSLLPL